MTRLAKSPPNQTFANTLGTIALDVLSTHQSATVLGNTSRGIFLKSPQWILFLSYEEYRGPMTVNLKGDISDLRNLTMGGLVQISPGLITVPEGNLTISSQDADIWHPAPPSKSFFTPTECRIRIKNVAQAVYHEKQGDGLSDLLPSLLEAPFDSEKMGSVPQDFQEVIPSLRIFDLTTSTENIEKILGRGVGLTPSGDDFLIGLLLTINRWKEVLRLKDDFQSLNDQVVHAAYEKTTTLSANLIDCAARGLADERLINALDYLLTGAGKKERVIRELLNWGNSSGIDAMVGMVTVLSKLVTKS